MRRTLFFESHHATMSGRFSVWIMWTGNCRDVLRSAETFQSLAPFSSFILGFFLFPHRTFTFLEKLNYGFHIYIYRERETERDRDSHYNTEGKIKYCKFHAFVFIRNFSILKYYNQHGNFSENTFCSSNFFGLLFYKSYSIFSSVLFVYQ